MPDRRPKPIPVSTGGMNKTEQAYADRLELLKRTGEIVDWRFEALKLRLASGTFYTVDFLVLTDAVELHEVKGYWRDDARVKIKVAAQQYPWFKFLAVHRKKNDWIVEMFKP